MDHALLVDPDDRFHKKLRATLERRGIGLIGVETARAGIRRFRADDPGFVFTEAVLPDGDGTIVLDAADKKTSYTPVVVVAQGFTTDTLFSAISRGAYDCLPKYSRECGKQLWDSRLRVNPLLFRCILFYSQRYCTLHFSTALCVTWSLFGHRR